MKSVAAYVSIDLLKDNANVLEAHLQLLLHAALRYAAKPEVFDLVRIHTNDTILNAEIQTLWYGAGFLLDSDGFRDSLALHIGSNENRAAQLLSFVRPSGGINRDIHYPLSVSALSSLIAITGHYFHPNDPEVSGWLGPHSRREAAISVRSLILRLGKELTTEATSELVKLQDVPLLVAWRSSIANVLADQTRQRRELAFKYPSVDQVLETLNRGRPANATDLQALVSSHLHSLRAELQDGPTDGWKAMWNVDRYARPTTPRPENDCRDRLPDHLRPRLLPVGVTAEPEGHYAEDKRADIKAIIGHMNLPIEIKRHYHADLWTAPREQLQKLYARDPGTAGRGIYLVLWFGNATFRVPTPPDGIDLPPTHFELESALQKMLPPSAVESIEIIVIDCAKRKQGGKGSKATRRLKRQR